MKSLEASSGSQKASKRHMGINKRRELNYNTEIIRELVID